MKKEYDFNSAGRGAVIPATPGKERITIRLDHDLVDWFRQQVRDAGGGNYQTPINEALKEFVRAQREPLEETLPRVLREELHAVASGLMCWTHAPLRSGGNNIG